MNLITDKLIVIHHIQTCSIDKSVSISVFEQFVRSVANKLTVYIPFAVYSWNTFKLLD